MQPHILHLIIHLLRPDGYPPLTPTRRRRRRLRNLNPRILRHHPLKPNPHALNHRQQNRTSNGSIPYRPRPTSHRQRAPREETRNNRIPRILLPPDALDGAVEGAEHAAPDAEVAAQHGGARFDGCHGADEALIVGGVAEAFDAVPDCAADGLIDNY